MCELAQLYRGQGPRKLTMEVGHLPEVARMEEVHSEVHDRQSAAFNLNHL